MAISSAFFGLPKKVGTFLYQIVFISLVKIYSLSLEFLQSIFYYLIRQYSLAYPIYSGG
jgi:hypothetical protein